MNSTVAPTSSIRAMLIDLPWHRVSSCANSSPCASTKAVKRSRMRSRSAGRRPDQTRASCALRADSTARSTSSTLASATWAMVSPVAGFNTGEVAPSGTTHWPSMKQPCRRCRKAATCGSTSTLLIVIPHHSLGRPRLTAGSGNRQPLRYLRQRPSPCRACRFQARRPAAG
ncbi:hypothetical protein D3C80_655930 [compost metagenome]